MLRGCFANSFCQRPCSGLSWTEVPCERAMAKLKAAWSSPPAPASSCQRNPGKAREPAQRHLCRTAGGPLPLPRWRSSLPLLVVTLAGPIMPCSERTATPGEHQGQDSASHWELMGLFLLLMGGTWAQPLCLCPYLDLHGVTLVMLSSPRWSELQGYQFPVSSANVESKQMSFR